MNIKSKVKSVRQSYRSGGAAGLSDDIAHYLSKSSKKALSSFYPSKNIFDYDWDLLIVLDGCRYDLMTSVNSEYNFANEIEKKRSVGSKTTEWMNKTFSDRYRKELKKTIYITGNPNSHKFANQKEFHLLDEVWRYGWDDELGTIPPKPITDRAISLSRSNNSQRMLLHYMQPHAPFIPDLNLGGKDSWQRITGFSDGESHNNVWKRLEQGKIDEDKVWDAYHDNLLLVLNNIQTLLNNIEAEKVVITSDHGNAMGEFGIYGHPAHTPIPSLRNVPWIKTEATDSKEYKPPTWIRDEPKQSVEDLLHDLGYKN